ncbi:EF-P beta-lysylation protein EpmB [Beggiatoa leptomitoformis]|uniref:L-lysine 2,3-aminomutase n=1 Tax=Beggiatoa leptomitoformis TaxID=288004 RepID=A0A2N9YJ51_9GAMM|nr:EF-P beta-lysylation protein EpmB [Beggiatoa leptomitoformis]ALG69559.2 EF-P beta-lysylation protein EpmB [Beggiatoa leptomitoformis]AUI70552.2 EF-P beta-lysylation protein EpmB [Beggiatoa leptomitoformis]
MMNSLTFVQNLPQTPWQTELQHAVRDPATLLKQLDLPTSLLTTVYNPARFALRVPRGYVARMRKADPNDPLLRQVLPLVTEQDKVAGFTLDPVGDQQSEKVTGLLHKYQGRVLLITTGACAVHCRYCFRQHFAYADAHPLREPAVWEYLQAHTDIKEVILSGGDPLTLTDKRLAEFVQRLASVSHIQRLRIHSRLPIVLPERITDDLLTLLTTSRLQSLLVVHTNHPNELDLHVIDALHRLNRAGVTLLNQTVLLKGVNDTAETLVQLSEQLFHAKVMPYYLNVLDRAQGTAHFEISLETAQGLLESLRCQLSGYLVPKLVREVAGAPYKVPVY